MILTHLSSVTLSLSGCGGLLLCLKLLANFCFQVPLRFILSKIVLRFLFCSSQLLLGYLLYSVSNSPQSLVWDLSGSSWFLSVFYPSSRSLPQIPPLTISQLHLIRLTVLFRLLPVSTKKNSLTSLSESALTILCLSHSSQVLLKLLTVSQCLVSQLLSVYSMASHTIFSQPCSS